VGWEHSKRTDALRTYLTVIEDAFGSEIDYAQLHKVYRAPADNETRYSPAKVISSSMKAVSAKRAFYRARDKYRKVLEHVYEKRIRV
jgi:hypothetical protein